MARKGQGCPLGATVVEHDAVLHRQAGRVLRPHQTDVSRPVAGHHQIPPVVGVVIGDAGHVEGAGDVVLLPVEGVEFLLPGGLPIALHQGGDGDLHNAVRVDVLLLGLVAAQGGRAVQLALAHGDVGQVVLADGQNIRDDRGGAGLTVGRQSGTGDVQGGVPVGQGGTSDRSIELSFLDRKTLLCIVIMPPCAT